MGSIGIFRGPFIFFEQKKMMKVNIQLSFVHTDKYRLLETNVVTGFGVTQPNISSK